MKKVVFFDLNKTLIDNNPSREEMEYNILNKEKGYQISMDTINKAYAVADEYFYNECARLPLIERSPQEKLAVYYMHQVKVLEYCGVVADDTLVKYIMKRYSIDCKTMKVFDDAMETLNILHQKGLKTGLISNSDSDISCLLDELGLSQKLDYVITSAECGATKPKAAIFNIALQKASITAAEALYIGDQVDIDVAGAQNAGIDYLLIDRLDHHHHIKERRIQDMRQVWQYI
ncbi:MAG: HAD family hydrolase [Chloroflexi bacterium]|nr:HAD family hydrolase [Chloroflexota bacterium]